MKIVIDDAFHNSTYGLQLYDELLKNDTPVTYVSLENKNIQTCLSCEYCKYKEFGKCCLKDDMQEILYLVGSGASLILVTRIKFGCYSSTMKKMFDRLVILGNMEYCIRNKEITKKKAKEFYIDFEVVVIHSGLQENEKIIFEQFLDETAILLQTKKKVTYIFDKGVE